MKINVSNEKAITTALAEVQGKAEVNTIDAPRLRDIAAIAEQRLDAMNLPQKYRAGARFEFCDAGPSANSYKFRQGATNVTIERGVSDWFLTEAKRIEIYPKSKEHRQLYLTPGQNDLALEIVRGSYRVLPVPTA